MLSSKKLQNYAMHGA